MKKSIRALAGLVALDLVIGGGAWWMIERTQSGAWNSNDPAASISMIVTAAGMMAGVVTAILLIAFFRHRRAGN